MNWEMLGRVADFAGIVGVGVSALAAWKAASAAKAARAARDAIRRSNSLTDLSDAVDLMRQVVSLQQNARWTAALGSYAQVRRLLIRVRESGSNVARTPLQTAIRQLGKTEALIEESLHSSQTPDLPTVNATMRLLADKLESELVRLRKAVVEEHRG